MCNSVLSLDRINQLKDNAMLKVKPELWEQWDFEMNGELGHDIWKMTYGSNKKVWWVCINEGCRDKYDMTIKNKISHSQGCPFCSGKRANNNNSLASKFPDIAKEWHPTKNGELTPHDVTFGSGQKVWWLGKCGHEWDDMRVTDKVHGQDCPYCSTAPKRILIGFNDMWTTNPELASMLADPDDGYKYTQSSEVKVDWNCKQCNCKITNKNISMIKENGLSCPKCGDGRSFGEKVLYGLLHTTMKTFEPEKIFDWLNNKRYDFYFEHEKNKVIIEVHGMQHFSDGFKSCGGKNCKEEQANDKFKYEMAITNGIKPENYIVIDCRYSDFEFIKNNILNSRLAELFDLTEIEWEGIYKYSRNSNVFVCAELWNKGLTTSQIGKIIRYSSTSVLKNLKKAKFLGLCDYDSKNRRNPPNVKLNKPIVQLTMDGELVKHWGSIKEASQFYGDKRGNSIGRVLSKKYKQLHGYKWVYLKDYKKEEEKYV